MKTPVINQVTFVCFLAKLQYPTGLLKYLLLLFILNSPVMQAQVGVHTDFPDASSAMDIYANNRGLLIPRVTLSVDLGNPSPVTSPAVGLLVFNSGANQPMGFYYWDGSMWVSTSGIAGNDYWLLKGNSGTEAGTNYIGTNDNEDFVIFTNEAERMRVEADGQVVIDSAGARYSNDVFTVFGNSNQTSVINAYNAEIGVYTESDYAGFFTSGGDYGLISLVNSGAANAIYATNSNVAGNGILAGGGGSLPYTLNNSYTGLASTGGDGIFSYGVDGNGTGIIAVGSAGDTAFLIPEGAGGAFTGYHGVYSRARNTSGTGVIGGGNYGPAYTITGGSGGAFTGIHGLISTATNASSGTGVIGIGNNGGYYLYPNGSGGAFTGTTIGVAGYGLYGAYLKSIDAGGTGVIGIGNNGSAALTSTGSGGAFSGSQGVFGKGTLAAGYGVIGIGSNLSSGYPIITNGSGGSFTGYHGLISKANNSSGTGIVGSGNNNDIIYLAVGTGGSFSGYHGVFGKGSNAAQGTGIIGLGNNISSYSPYTSGSGGAFYGTEAGVVGWGTTTATGTGVIGAGNNAAATVVPTGSGGAFTGTVCGAYGYATNTSNDRYGGYFATGGSLYAYVGGRYSNTNRKIVGTGNVSTIVKNRNGERITLTCPEAPESLFQDYGIGQLVNGMAHITIDPDLAININVSEDHPLKVYITPEGDCNGVYVTNKSANGFDVIELQGGKSNITFSWQIVATRANEEYVLRDGTIEISDYSQRFQPAPGPLETTENPVQTDQLINNEIIPVKQVLSETETVNIEHTKNEKILQAIDGSVIIPIEAPDEKNKTPY